MIGRRTILEIYQLKEQGFTVRSIARQLQINRETVSKYLAEPSPGKTKQPLGKSKLDPYKDMIDKLIEQCPDVKAPVVLQRLRDKGFDGEITIVRDMLRQLRGRQKNRQAFIRFESEPGEHYGKKEIMLRCTSKSWHFLDLESSLFHIISLQ
jgi:transposase